MKRIDHLTNDHSLIIIFCIGILVGLNLSCNEDRQREQGDSGQRDHSLETERDSAYIVEVTAADYAFGMPSEVPSGWVTFKMKNMGQETHNAVIFKYNDSLTYKDLGTMIGEAIQREDMSGFYEMQQLEETPMGGPAILSPGLLGETTVHLEPGIYALTCWMRAEDGEYHIKKGMTRPFKVTSEESGATKPRTTVDITMENLAINIEDSIPPGDHVFNVKFDAEENVHLAKLEEGQTLQGLKEWMILAQNPSPFTFLGGAEQAKKGMTNTFKASLEPGRYAFVTYGTAISGMAEEIEIPVNGAAGPVLNEPVNPPVTASVNAEGLRVEKDLKPGRTLLNLKTSEEKEGFYLLIRGKVNATIEEIRKVYGESYMYENDAPSKQSRPFYFVWWGPLESDEEQSLNLEIEDVAYVLVGPTDRDEVIEAWEKGELFHVLRGK